jgi:TfoX/Sxy family transcriptional regulator of competence genes
MPYSEALANRVREALETAPSVTEKTMFRGLAFMVNGKLCMAIGPDDVLCRIGPEEHGAAVELPGVEAMIMNGREAVGYVRVHESVLRTKRELDHWVGLCLAYNPAAKAAPKKRSAAKKTGKKV